MGIVKGAFSTTLALDNSQATDILSRQQNDKINTKNIERKEVNNLWN